jgi:hypothetical protein
MSSPYLPTLYKARHVPTKQPVCAICVERTRGRTQHVRLGHRVGVWLCEAHGSREFQTRRNGRDFVRTLHGVWQANDCLTLARSRALDAHLAGLRERPQRARPGSYAWPELRHALEHRYARGASPTQLALLVHDRYRSCPAHAPALARAATLADTAAVTGATIPP